MTIRKLLAATAAAALLTTTAHAQMFGSDYGSDLNQENFNRGFAEQGTYSAWDQNDDAGLDQNELGAGMYADWDTDNDLQITEDEWNAGTERWYGADYDGSFAEWDADGSGAINQQEFGGAWDDTYYTNWDANQDQVLSEDEFNTGIYNSADLDDNLVISIEEEGWFEGWFDGDDIEAEIEEVGDVM